MPKLLPDNIKEEILSTTRRLVMEQGYNKLSIRDIAKECGIATGTFYNYYRSKQAILSALLADDWDKMQQFLKSQNISQGKTPIDRLEEVFSSLKAMMISVHQLWALGFPDDFESETMNKMSQIKRQLRIDFAQTIRRIIHGHTEPEKEEFVSGFLSRMFFSYAYEQNSSFSDLRFILDKLIH